MIPKGQSESVYQRRRDNTMDKWYQRANQNPYIKEEETTQWTKYTKGPIRICISKKKRQHNGQMKPINQSKSQQFFICSLVLLTFFLSVSCFKYLLLVFCFVVINSCVYFVRRGLHISWYNLLSNPIVCVQ
jgi:hypothetical protein